MRNSDVEYLRSLAVKAMEAGELSTQWRLGDVADRYDKICDAAETLFAAVDDKVWALQGGKAGASVSARGMDEKIDRAAAGLDELLTAIRVP